MTDSYNQDWTGCPGLEECCVYNWCVGMDMYSWCQKSNKRSFAIFVYQIDIVLSNAAQLSHLEIQETNTQQWTKTLQLQRQ